MHIGTKVGEFSVSKRQKLSANVEVETTYQGDIISEHRYTQKAQEEIQSNFQKFAEKYGMSTGAAEKKRGSEAKSVASGLLN